MRYILMILILFPMLVKAQFTPGSWKRPSYIWAGEYFPNGYDSITHQCYYYPNTGGQPQLIPGQPAYSQEAWGGPHGSAETDTLGNVYFYNQTGVGSGSSSMLIDSIDSAGARIPPIVDVLLSGTSAMPFWYAAIVTTKATGGKVGVAGSLQGSLRGNGTAGSSAQTTFVWVPILNNDTIIKVTGLYAIFGLTSQGKVQSWGASNDPYSLGQGASPANGTPGYVQGIPTGWFAYDVTSNVVGTWIFCDSANHTYHKILTAGWQYDPAYQGRGTNGAQGLTHFQDVTNNAFLSPMTQGGSRWVTFATSNSESYYFICNDGTLWDIGGNAVGTIGNGKSMNLASVNYFYNQGQNNFNQDTVYNVAPGTTNWKYVYETPSNCWYTYATNTSGQLYQWGNNKGGEAWNGILDPGFVDGLIHADYPNSWCVLWPTLITWPSIAIVDKLTTSPYCILNPSGSPCNSVTNPTHTPPTATITGIYSNGNIILYGSGTTSNVPLMDYVVYQTNPSSDPAVLKMKIQAAGPSQSGIADTIPASVTGTYNFTVRTRNTSWDSSFATVSVVVGASTQTQFYFSNSGSDANACTLLSPCKTVSKFNSLVATLGAGDTVFFQRGSIFNGEFFIGVSGISGNPLVLTSYGSGPMPILGSMFSVTGWTNIGGNVYEASYAGINPTLLTINNVLAPKASTYNSTPGYWTMTPINTTSFTDATHASVLTVGDSIAIRSSAYTINHAVIIGISGSTITFSPAASYSGVGGVGYFVYDVPSINGEWRYTGSQLEIASATSPTGIAIPANDTVLYSTGQHLLFSNLMLEGGNSALAYFSFQTTGDITLLNDSLLYAYDGIFSRGAQGVNVIGGYIGHMVDNAIYKEDPTPRWTVTGVKGRDIGMIPGMGGNGPAGNYQFINYSTGDSAEVVSYNDIDSVGYIAVSGIGSGTSMDSNIVNHFCWILTDGAGVYSWKSAPSIDAQQKKIIGNLIFNGGGPMSANGTSLNYNPAYGVYLDEYSDGWLVSNNSVDSVAGSAYFDHGDSNTFVYNTGYGVGYSQFLAQELSGGPVINGLVIKHNIFGSASSANPIFRLITTGTDLSTFGTSDSNQIVGAIGVTTPFYTQSSGDAGTSRTLSSWTTNTGYDTHSGFVTANTFFIYNKTTSTRHLGLLAIYLDPFGNLIYGNNNIQPYSSLILTPWRLGYITIHPGMSL